MTREFSGLFHFKFRLRYHKDKESPRVRSARSQRGRTDDKFANEEIWFSILSGLGPTINPEDEKEKVKNPKWESAYGQYDSENTLYAEIDQEDINMCKALREQIFDFQGDAE